MNRIATDPHWLRTLLLAGATDHRPDAELLDRYARYGEQAAFEAILRRHGPLVWGVCRRTLSNPADADDAFQATFLVLVQKAGRVKHGDRLGPWLYGVAVKVARRLRDKSRRAPNCDPELAALLPDRDRPDPDADWLAHLDRELHALPAKFRDPMVLCELQGLTRTAAAERLRLREGTLSSRLARGRILLRQRLLKYGTLLPAGGLTTLLGTASTAPARLLGKTAESVAQVTAAGGILTGIVPASVARLTLKVTGMGLFKLKIATAMAVTLATLTLGLVTADGPAVKADKPAVAVPKAVAAVEKPAAIEGDLAALQGLWEMGALMDFKGGQPEPQNLGRGLVCGNVLWIIPRQGEDNSHAARYEATLTPGRNPKWIDLVTDGCTDCIPAQPRTFLPSIYQMTADGWEMALSASVEPFRPAEFGTDPKTVTTLKFRRPKALVPTAGVKGVQGGEKDSKLLGRWTVTQFVFPDANHTGMMSGSGGVVEITPEFLFIQRMGVNNKPVWEAAEYTLDPTKDPKWIDLKFPSKQKELADGYGVYELTGDAMRISYRQAAPRVFRTLEFRGGPNVPLNGPDDKSGVLPPACSLLELKRVETP